tara:strand:- start:1142 stop:1246 length:105 start_codon:yes stop_codon:yes gene_type:complete
MLKNRTKALNKNIKNLIAIIIETNIGKTTAIIWL